MAFLIFTLTLFLLLLVITGWCFLVFRPSVCLLLTVCHKSFSNFSSFSYLTNRRFTSHSSVFPLLFTLSHCSLVFFLFIPHSSSFTSHSRIFPLLFSRFPFFTHHFYFIHSSCSSSYSSLLFCLLSLSVSPLVHPPFTYP